MKTILRKLTAYGLLALLASLALIAQPIVADDSTTSSPGSQKRFRARRAMCFILSFPAAFAVF